MAEKILIVDDDLDSLKLIGLMLQRQGYEIVAASAGAQAIAKATAEAPDLIILDVMMPDMDGYEVSRRLRANPSTQDIPIIMFTAKTLVDDKVAGFEAGADDYLTKPTHPAELASRVKAVLARRAAKRGAAAELGTLLAVIGAKGGVGTTTLAMNLAAALNSTSEGTILADVRPGQGSLGISLGFGRATGLANLLTRPITDLNPRAVGAELVSHKSGLRLLLSSVRPREANLNMAPEVVSGILRHLRGLGKMVVVDLGTGLSPANQRVLREATHVIVVSEPQRIPLNMTRALLNDLNDLGVGPGRVSIVLVNRAQSGLQISWQEAEQILGREIQGVIPPAPDLILQAVEAAQPVVNLQPDAIVTAQFQKIAEKVVSQVGDSRKTG